MIVQGEATLITLLVTQTLERLGIPYAVGGSLASSLHGVMRSTLDVDIVADMRLEHIQPMIAVLSKEFYADDEMMKDAIEHQSSFNLIHYETAFKVDIFIRKSRAFDQMQLERRRMSVISVNPEESVYVTSPEDTVLAKLEWYRMGGEVSDRQWRDTPQALGYSKPAQVNSISITCINGQPNSTSTTCWNALCKHLPDPWYERPYENNLHSGKSLPAHRP
ncbi:MAG TPA: hypothetical protein VJ785_01240 [Anaerolineales bacterium]|nr:hypothetical protein [Anaerolineales bacterium]